MLRAEDDAGRCPEREDGDLPPRAVGERAVAAVEDGDPPAGPLERAGLVDRDEAEAAAGEPALVGAERVRHRCVSQVGELVERHLGDRRQAGGEAAEEWAGGPVGQGDFDHVGSAAVRGSRT